MTATETKTNAEIYAEACAAFIPAPEDNPDNVPFYRTWYGLKAVLAEHGYADPFKAPLNVHGICCWAKGGTWEEVLNVIPMHTPKEPKRLEHVRCYYDSEPTPPTEKDARRIFETQYRNAYPKNRINSKHAKEAWERVKAKAEKFAQAEYECAKAEYDAKIAKREQEERASDDAHALKMDEYRKALELIHNIVEK